MAMMIYWPATWSTIIMGRLSISGHGSRPGLHMVDDGSGETYANRGGGGLLTKYIVAFINN